MSKELEPTSRGILRHAVTLPGQQSVNPVSGTTSISFAPLPPPVKRSKSHRKRPLGVAGRSTILQQQHRLRKHHSDSEHHENAYPRSIYHSDRHPVIQDDDDALIELTRLVKEAGKKIWKSLSSRPSTSSPHTTMPGTTEALKQPPSEHQAPSPSPSNDELDDAAPATNESTINSAQREQPPLLVTKNTL